VRDQAGWGGISRALKLGEAIFAAEKKGGKAVIDAICKATDGSILLSGTIDGSTLQYTPEAFDIGVITVKSGKKALHLHTMNEYMAVEDGDGQRLASYPDVIAVLDAEGRPVSAGKLKAGMAVHVFHIH